MRSIGWDWDRPLVPQRRTYLSLDHQIVFTPDENFTEVLLVVRQRRLAVGDSPLASGYEQSPDHLFLSALEQLVREMECPA